MTLRSPSKEAILERAAARLIDDETFLASALRDWSGGMLDLDALTTFLGGTRDAVVRLALCRRPLPSATTFVGEVTKIASYAGVHEVRVLELLREAASIAAFRQSAGSQVLAAARDDRGPQKKDEP